MTRQSAAIAALGPPFKLTPLRLDQIRCKAIRVDNLARRVIDDLVLERTFGQPFLTAVLFYGGHGSKAEGQAEGQAEAKQKAKQKAKPRPSRGHAEGAQRAPQATRGPTFVIPWK